MNTAQAVNRILELNSSPLFIILIGAPGSGKSTFIAGLKPHMSLTVGSTDDLIDEYAAKHKLTYTEAFGKLNFKGLKVRMEQEVKEAVSKGRHVVIDQTNMHRKSRSGKLAMAAANSAFVKVAVDFDVQEKVLLERLDARAAATGKVIPRNVLYSMLKSYEAPTKVEGFDVVLKVS